MCDQVRGWTRFSFAGSKGEKSRKSPALVIPKVSDHCPVQAGSKVLSLHSWMQNAGLGVAPGVG
jgi:hypothetical protein